MNLQGFIEREKVSKGAHLSESFHEEGLPEFLPKLHTLVLTNNQLTNLVEIDPLTSLPKLQFLSLLDNNITKKPNYRLYVIHKLKSFRLLDFKRVKHKEQIEAKNLFSSEEDEEQAKKEFARTFVPGEALSIPEDPKEEQAPKLVAPTPEQIITIKAAIVNSQTLEEVARLEKASFLQILKSVIMMPRLTLKQPEKTKMVTDEENEVNGPSDAEPEQKNNESADMEQHHSESYSSQLGWYKKATQSHASTSQKLAGERPTSRENQYKATQQPHNSETTQQQQLSNTEHHRPTSRIDVILYMQWELNLLVLYRNSWMQVLVVALLDSLAMLVVEVFFFLLIFGWLLTNFRVIANDRMGSLVPT
ncbi:hypothetical protein ACSBR1_031368 [Camellia fascicularis]